MKPMTTKRLCRAGVIAALYTLLTYVFLPFAFGPFQVRVAEALCILPLFFPEAVPALAVGCLLSNLSSPYLAFDLPIGTLVTLLSALGTYFVGRVFQKDWIKLALGGAFPVLLNALVLPLLILFVGGESYHSLWIAYLTTAVSILCTQSVCVYGLGTPLYYAIKKLYK